MQTDTTVGFASQDAEKLAKTKGRSLEQPFLKTLPSLTSLKQEMRIPKTARKRIRNAKRTTFIYPNKSAIRVVSSGEYHEFLERINWAYSSSANKTQESFESKWAQEKADVIICGDSTLGERKASQMIELGKNKIKRVR